MYQDCGQRGNRAKNLHPGRGSEEGLQVDGIDERQILILYEVKKFSKKEGNKIEGEQQKQLK